MSQWFRMYNEALDDPKVQQLPAEIFKGWVNLLCLAARHDGVFQEQDIPFALRISQAKADALVESVVKAGLFERAADGLTPHNWNGRQHKSDVSNDRVKRHRERRRNVECNVTPTVTVTPSETETETEQINSDPNGSGGKPPDVATVVFSTGLSWLQKSTGKPESQCRSLLGKWRKDHGDEALIAALGAAQREGSIDAVAFIEGTFKHRRAGPQRITPLGVGG